MFLIYFVYLFIYTTKNDRFATLIREKYCQIHVNIFTDPKCPTPPPHTYKLKRNKTYLNYPCNTTTKLSLNKTLTLLAAYDILDCLGSSSDSKLAIQRDLAWSKWTCNYVRFDHYNTNWFKILLIRDRRGAGSKYFPSLNTSVDVIRVPKVHTSGK